MVSSKEEIIEANEMIVKKMLLAIGENPDREGLKDTPKRVVKMWKEIFRGYDKEQLPKITTFKNGSDSIIYDQALTDEGIFYSHCEHHCVPFFGNYYFSVIYNTKGYILGLSKIGRIVDYYSARLQIQERLTQQIVNHIWNTLCDASDEHPPIGMGLVMIAEHLCKSMRGLKKVGKARTVALKDAMLLDEKARSEFLNSVNANSTNLIRR